MEPPPLLGHGGPLLLEVLQELTQGLDGAGDVGCIYGCAPDDDVYIDEASQVKKHEEHLLVQLVCALILKILDVPLGSTVCSVS